MALASPSSAEILQPNPEKSDAESPPVASMPPPSTLTTTVDSSSSTMLGSTAPLENPTNNLPIPSPTLYSNPNPSLSQNPGVVAPPAPAAPSFTPSFRPYGAPSIPQYTTVPNLSIQPPGVSAPIASVNPMMQGAMSMYPAPPGMPQASAPLSYGSNGYMSVPVPAPHAYPPPVDHV